MTIHQAAKDLIVAHDKVAKLEDDLAEARQQLDDAEHAFARAQTNDDSLFFSVNFRGLEWLIKVDEESRKPVMVLPLQGLNPPS